MTCLLESVVGGERSGRYFHSFTSAHSDSNKGTTTELITDDKVVETYEGDPFEFIRNYMDRFNVANRPGVPRFTGGLAGYIGYDAVRHMEPSLGPAVKPFPHGQGEGTPDIMLMHIDEAVIVDNVIGRTYLLVYADPTQPDSYSKGKKRLLDFAVCYVNQWQSRIVWLA
ncbi:anthranilate synthase component I [Oligella ureolytica]